MGIYFDEAIQELKRADHLVFVSLKYTRTVDVIKSVIERLISTLDFATMDLMEYAQEKKFTKEPLNNPVQRAESLKQIFSAEADILAILDLYLLLRKISRASYTSREEFRRHVTMIADVDEEGIINVDIDLLREYYEQTKTFVRKIKKLSEGTEDD